MENVKDAVRDEVILYLFYCEAVTRHDQFELQYRLMARAIFRHIEEMRNTGKVTPLGQVTHPIS